MPNSGYMQKATGKGLAKLMLTTLVVLAAVVIYVFVSSYQGRDALVTSQRNACERGKLDRKANASGWRTAEFARKSTVAKDLDISIEEVVTMMAQKPRSGDPPDLIAARRYDNIAHGLEMRGKIVCDEVFPAAEVLP